MALAHPGKPTGARVWSTWRRRRLSSPPGDQEGHALVVLHTAIAIAVIVLLIIKVKVDPVISLIIGSLYLYLGLATGVGLTATLTAIAAGFGEIMGEVGLLIGFGVLIGALLHAMGAFRKMVTLLVNGVGAHRLPYALTAAMSTIFPSI